MCRDTRRINFHRSIPFSRNQVPSPPPTRYRTSAHPLEIPSAGPNWPLEKTIKSIQPLEKSSSNPRHPYPRGWMQLKGGGMERGRSISTVQIRSSRYRLGSTPARGWFWKMQERSGFCVCARSNKKAEEAGKLNFPFADGWEVDAEQGEGVVHPVCNTSDSSFPLCFAFLPSFSNRDDEMQKIFRLFSPEKIVKLSWWKDWIF